LLSKGRFEEAKEIILKMAKYNKVETPDLTPLRSTMVKFVLKMAKYNKVEQMNTNMVIRMMGICLTPLSTIFQLYIRWSVLLMEETGVPGENHRPPASH
jgi:hypothetical protein